MCGQQNIATWQEISPHTRNLRLIMFVINFFGYPHGLKLGINKDQLVTEDKSWMEYLFISFV